MITTLVLSLLLVPSAVAGSPHFVGRIDVVRDGNSLTVAGKIAGLGNENQVEVLVTATAQCLNPGGNPPQAGNKQDLAAQGQFPVQSAHDDPLHRRFTRL